MKNILASELIHRASSFEIGFALFDNTVPAETS